MSEVNFKASAISLYSQLFHKIEDSGEITEYQVFLSLPLLYLMHHLFTNNNGNNGHF
jgi:hypothetical protein